MILAKNATLKDVLDEIKKNRKFSKNEALFCNCKQKETENMDGAKIFIEMFPWILNFNRLHITTAEFIEVQATIFFIQKIFYQFDFSFI